MRTHLNLAGNQKKQKDFEKAIINYQTALKISPFDSKNYKNLGDIYSSMDEWELASVCYKQSIKLDSTNIYAYTSLGIAYHEKGEIDFAIKNYFYAIEIDQYYSEAFTNLGLAYLEKSDWEKALINFLRGYSLRRDEVSLSEEITTSLPKIKHDIEQIEYLIKHNLIDSSYKKQAESYQFLYDELLKNKSDNYQIDLNTDQKNLIKDFYGKSFYIYKPNLEFESIINKNLDIDNIVDDYQENYPGYTYFDDFLSEEVIDELYKYCLKSTIWNDDKKIGGYIGSYVDDGFSCELLYKISEEIRLKFYQIINYHPLTYMWAYKYDSELTGIKPHADRAIINVNFWITPEEANLNSDSGGLIIYDKAAPPEWNYDYYNVKTKTIERFLKNNEAQKIKIKYKRNRAVIFNSRLFHESDELNFKEGYENRRINITMLFGSRVK